MVRYPAADVGGLDVDYARVETKEDEVGAIAGDEAALARTDGAGASRIDSGHGYRIR